MLYRRFPGDWGDQASLMRLPWNTAASTARPQKRASPVRLPAANHRSPHGTGRDELEASDANMRRNRSSVPGTPTWLLPNEA
ncbi:MAG: hypothetical protein R3B96_11445 [Pirellulaceae bacterium]